MKLIEKGKKPRTYCSLHGLHAGARCPKCKAETRAKIDWLKQSAAEYFGRLKSGS